MRRLLAALVLLAGAAGAAAQPAADGQRGESPQSWDTPMSAGDRAFQQGRYAEAERFFAAALDRA